MKIKKRNLSTRQLQLYAALCLRYYCLQLKISHEAIDELFDHLVSIATTKHLNNWEQQGTKIQLAGRGEPTPKSVIEAVPAELLVSFTDLVDNCVEVGLVDMYGDCTDERRRFANRCVAILINAKVTVPPIDELYDQGQRVDGWGNVITQTQLDEILLRYE